MLQIINCLLNVVLFHFTLNQVYIIHKDLIWWTLKNALLRCWALCTTHSYCFLKLIIRFKIRGALLLVWPALRYHLMKIRSAEISIFLMMRSWMIHRFRLDFAFLCILIKESYTIQNIQSIIGLWIYLRLGQAAISGGRALLLFLAEKLCHELMVIRALSTVRIVIILDFELVHSSKGLLRRHFIDYWQFKFQWNFNWL